MGMAKEILHVDRQTIPGGKDKFYVDLHIPLEQFNKIIEWGEYITSVIGMDDKGIDFLQELTSMQSDIKKYMKKG